MDCRIITPIENKLSLSLFSEPGSVIDFRGQKFTADATKAYIQFKLSHAFPVATVYGTALHPAVIEKSYHTLLHQNLNYEHQLQAYVPKDDPRASEKQDRVVGSIVAVDFPKQPNGNWRLTNPIESPAVEGVAVIFKQAKGMATVLGSHVTGRKTHSVSMEVLWPFEECGFAIAVQGEPLVGYKPKDPLESFYAQDMLKNGFEFVPAESAPEELKATFSKKKTRIVATYKGRKVFALMGGVSNPVHYAGTGIVEHHAEPPAKIMRLAASDDSHASPVIKVADSLSDAIKSLGLSLNPKTKIT